MVGLTRSLAPRLLSPHNTALHAICPGCVDTPMSAPVAAVTPQGCVTPMDTVLRVYAKLLHLREGSAVETGQTVEL